MEPQLEITKQTEGLAVISRSPIVDQATLDRAAQALVMGKGLIRKIEGYFAPMKQGAYDSWKRICAQEKEELDKARPIVAALDLIIVDYRMAEERKRQAAENERRRQEEERRQLAEKALREAEEKERQAREAEARAALEKDAEAKKKAREEAARAQAEADKIISRAVEVEKKFESAVVVPPPTQRTEGLGMRENWILEVVDEKLIPREYCVPDWVRLNKLAKVEKDKLSIPGVRAVNKPVTVARQNGAR